MIKRIKNSLPFAYVQGAWECWTLGNGVGRSHPSNSRWDDAYDRGMTLTERLRASLHR